MVRFLTIFFFITNLYANANNELSSFAEQDTVRLNQTVVSTPPVAVVEGFKIVLREQRISRGKNQFSKMRLEPIDAASMEKMSQKVDIVFDVLGGDTISLDARKSYDDNQDKISYKWESMNNLDFKGVSDTEIGFRIPEVMIEQIFLFKVTLNDGRYNTVHLVGMRAKQGKMTSFKGAGDQVAQGGEKVQISAVAPGAVVNQDLAYLWRSPDGIALSSATDPVTTFKLPTLDTDTHYVFFLSVSGPDGEVVDRDTVRVTGRPKTDNQVGFVQGLNVAGMSSTKVGQFNDFLRSTVNSVLYNGVDIFMPLESPVSSTFLYPGGYDAPEVSPFQPVFKAKCSSLADATENALSVGATDVVTWDFEKNNVLKLNYYSVFETSGGDPVAETLKSGTIPLKMADQINLSTTIVLDEQGSPTGMTDIKPAVEKALKDMFAGKKYNKRPKKKRGSAQGIKGMIQDSFYDTVEFYKEHPEILAATAVVIGGLTIAIFGGDEDLGTPPNNFPFE
jgi:hypothetical protein